MEDEKTHLSLLQLRPPSSSSSPSSSFSNHDLTLINPPDSDSLLSFFNLPNTSHHLQIPPNFPSNDHLLPTSISPYNHLPSFMGGFGYAVHEDADQISNSETQKADHLLISSNGGKRRKMDNKREEKEKSREVVHVRAKRGQATDSHSLAERVRREKINEKIRVLQDLVPGCYKTMGMAVMLDVIINYVRSLQNQIEFLSMKLSAASLYFDFNSPEAEALEELQRANPCDAQEAEGMMREQGFDGTAFATWPPF